MMVSGLRGLAQPKPPEQLGAGRALRPLQHDRARTTTATCSTSYERQIVCVCESCWALRSGDAEFRPDRAAARCGSRTSSCPRSSGPQFRIPIGLAFFMHSTRHRTASWRCTRARPGATESELHFETWSRLVAMNPVLRDLEPDAEALIVNRMSDPPAFAIAPIDRCYMLVGLIKASLGGHLGRRRGGAGDRGATSTSCGRWPREPAARSLEVAGGARARVPGARRHRPPARRGAGARLRRARRGAERAAGLRDRAHGAGDDRAGAARATTRRRARSSSSCSARRSAGPRRPAASSGTRPTCSCPPSPARPRSASPLPCTLRPGGRRRRSTSTALPDGEVPLAFNFNGTVHYRGDDGRLQMSLVPWCCSAEFRLPVATWRDLIEHYYPSTGWIALREETLRALQREKARARAADAGRVRGGAARGASERRRARRLAALRGLRAVPVHAGSDQERDADAVRDRLPARLRGRTLDSTYDHLELQCIVEGDGEIDGRGALPAAERRAPPGGAAHACAGSGRVRARRRVASATALAASDAGARPPAGVASGSRTAREAPARRSTAPAGARATR